MLSKEDSEKNGAETAVKSRDCWNTVTILFGPDLFHFPF